MFDFLFYKKKSEAHRLLTGRLNQQTMAGLNPGERRAARNTYCEVVWLVGLDDFGRPDYENAEPVVSKDLSPSGLSLIHNHPVRDEYVLIGFRQPDGMTFLRCRRGHCTPLGCGFFQVGLSPESTERAPAEVVETLRSRFDAFRRQPAVV